jgi:hypothetical protein
MMANSNSIRDSDSDSEAGSKGKQKALEPTPPGTLSDYFPAKGERALSIGKTGSGKTLFNRWLLERLPDSPTIIYDTKHDPKFDRLPHHHVATTLDGVYEGLENLANDYIIVRPPPLYVASPQALDGLLLRHENEWRGIDAYIDELYHFHSGGRAGPGLSGLYTRGRSRGITTIGSTQRPAWVSGFVFSETQLFYLFRLTRESDRKKVNDFIPNFSDLPALKRFGFYAHRDDSEEETPKLMEPIPVDEKEKLGYTDHLETPEAANSETETEADQTPPNVWI